MKKIITLLVTLVLFTAPLLSFGAQLLNPEKINTDINITNDGRVSIKNAKIMQFAGNTIFIRLLWGETFIRMTLKTDKNVVVTKKYGESTTVAEMKVGDRLNVEGVLEPGPDSLTVITSSIKNLSDERGMSKFSGIITENATTTKGFMMRASDGRIITLSFEDNPKVIKGNRTVSYYDVRAGDIVENADGVFNFGTGVLRVSGMKVYIDLSVFRYQNFQGTLKKISGINLPAVLTVTIGGKDYTVKLPEDASVMNAKRDKTQFSRFVAGDEVRFWGAIPEGDDMYFVNALIIRNLSL